MAGLMTFTTTKLLRQLIQKTMISFGSLKWDHTYKFKPFLYYFEIIGEVALGGPTVPRRKGIIRLVGLNFTCFIIHLILYLY